MKGVWEELTVDNVDVLAGGIAFYSFLSLFPTLALLVLLYGLFGDPTTLETQLTWIAASLIPAARDVLSESLRLAAVERATFGIGALVAFLVASWTASRATNALLLSAQVAYDDTEPRSFFEQTRLNLLLTFGALAVGGLLLGSLGAAPGWLERTGLPELAVRAILLLRWPLFLGVVYLAVGQIYRLAPRKKRRGAPRTIAPGALVATVAWMLVSFGFSYYASSFGDYGGKYGALATVVVVLTWFFLSAYVFIIGAEINAEIDRVRLREESAPSFVAPVERVRSVRWKNPRGESAATEGRSATRGEPREAPSFEDAGDEEEGIARTHHSSEAVRASFDSLGEELAEKMLDAAQGGSNAVDEDERDPDGFGMHVIEASEEGGPDSDDASPTPIERAERRPQQR